MTETPININSLRARPSFAGRPNKNNSELWTMDDLQAQRLGKMILIYGPGGGGKTTLAATLWDYPYTSNMIIAASDIAGMSSIKDNPLCRVKPIYKFQDLVDWLQTQAERPDANAIVIDHLTRLIFMLMRDLYGPPPWDWKKYGTPVGIMRGLLEELYTWCQVHNNLVVLIAHDEWDHDDEENTGVTRSRFGLNMSGGFAKMIEPIPDIIMHMTLTPNGKSRKVSMAPANSLGKKRTTPSGTESTIPVEIYNPSLVPIMQALWDGIPFPVNDPKYRRVGGSEKAIEEKTE